MIFALEEMFTQMQSKNETILKTNAQIVLGMSLNLLKN